MKRLVIAIAALGLSAAAAMACEGQTGKVIFEDKFADDAGGWAFSAENNFTLKEKGAVFVVNAPENQSTQAQNQTFTAVEGDYCAEVALPEDAVRLNAEIGVEFLGLDYATFWLATAQSDGRVGLYKKTSGKWSTVWELPGNKVLKTGTGDVNSVRAVVKGGAITVIVNGQTIKTVRAQIPSTGDFKFGYYVAHSVASDMPVEFIAQSYKVTEVKQ